jgi:hypothetical protein
LEEKEGLSRRHGGTGEEGEGERKREGKGEGAELRIDGARKEVKTD